jgi:hypothetical protein
MRIVAVGKAIGEQTIRNIFEMVRDLTVAGRFWGKLGLTLVGLVIAALAVTALTPRLILVATAEQPEYLLPGNAAYSRERALHNLEEDIRAKLIHEVDSAFANNNSTEQNSSDAQKKLSAELAALFMGRLNVALKVTNTGSLSTTIDELGMFIVEEQQGRRQILESQLDLKINQKLGQGETKILEGELAREFKFLISGRIFRNYETVRIIKRHLLEARSGYSDVAPVVNAYLRILEPRDQGRCDQLILIANPRKTCRLLLVASVHDIYGRVATGEAELFNSSVLGQR